MGKIAGLELLRGIAAFGIVGCHLLISPRTELGTSVTSFCDLNVGIFAAVAGFLMAKGAVTGWRAYVCKRAKRILPTYFVWTVIYLVASALFQYVGSGAIKSRYGTVDFWIRSAFCGGSSAHLWFLICLFYAQCLLGAVRSVKISCFWFVSVGFLLVVLTRWTGGWFGLYPLRLLSFLVTGYGLGLIDWKPPLRFVWMCVAGALVLHVAFRGIVPGFVNDWIVAVPTILVFSQLRFPEGRLDRTAAFLGATSMGVYLIHPLLTAGFGVVVRKFFAQPYGVSAVMFDWLVCWLLALLMTVVLQRIPVFNRSVR